MSLNAQFAVCEDMVTPEIVAETVVRRFSVVDGDMVYSAQVCYVDDGRGITILGILMIAGGTEVDGSVYSIDLQTGVAIKGVPAISYLGNAVVLFSKERGIRIVPLETVLGCFGRPAKDEVEAFLGRTVRTFGFGHSWGLLRVDGKTKHEAAGS